MDAGTVGATVRLGAMGGAGPGGAPEGAKSAEGGGDEALRPHIWDGSGTEYRTGGPSRMH